jgi:hypothetical protein
MSKREKIIMLMVLLAVIYGAYSFLFSSSPSPDLQIQTKAAEELNNFITNLSKDIRKEGLTAADLDLLHRTAADWQNDPMIRSTDRLRPELEIEKDEAIVMDVPEDIDLVYSGYLSLGDLNLAIINNMEYQAGEELEQGGYVVEQIYPEKTIIRVIGTQRNIVVPLEEAGTSSKTKAS